MIEYPLVLAHWVVIRNSAGVSLPRCPIIWVSNCPGVYLCGANCPVSECPSSDNNTRPAFLEELPLCF